MFITKKHLSRRTVLRGLGVSVALPLLDSMVAAQTPIRTTAAAAKSRLSCIYVPHGATMDKWTPAATGKGFEFTEILSPLEKFRDRITIVSNLAHAKASAVGSDAGADHARSAAVFLSGAQPARDSIQVGETIDQIAARHIGQDTPLPSLELSIEDVALSCGSGYACAYSNTISWKNASTPLPMENNPQVVFEKLFGDGGNDADRAARRRQSRSLLDSVLGQVASLRNDLPAADRVRLTEYLDNVREIERRLQAVEKRNDSGEPRELPMAPRGVPDSFADHVKLMFDLQMLAFRSDITRVFSFKLGRDGSNRVYKESGSTGAFHIVSHHAENPERVRELAKINEFHVSMLPYLLKQLKETADDEGTMLDNSVVIYGSPMGNPNQHNHKRVPFLVAGHGGGAIKGGVHLKAKNGTPLSNVMLSLLHTLGHDDLQSFGDSEGTFSWD